jgi:hypothetical protein
MKMKKFLCILLVTALLFAFAACGGSDTSGENEIKVVVSTEGSGNIAFAYEGEEIDTEEDTTQLIQVTVYEPEKMTFVATPDEGYKFVKWTQDGADLSEDAEIQVEITQSTELVAIFDVA